MRRFFPTSSSSPTNPSNTLSTRTLDGSISLADTNRLIRQIDNSLPAKPYKFIQEQEEKKIIKEGPQTLQI